MMKASERRISTPVLVLGAGGSGLRAAIELTERGVDALVVSKRPRVDAHTSLAAGGINAALATIDPNLLRITACQVPPKTRHHQTLRVTRVRIRYAHAVVLTQHTAV